MATNRSENIRHNDPRFKDHIRTGIYLNLNAFRAVFEQALTCLKAQGGEWDEVYIYLDNKIQGYPRPYVYQRPYTSQTRAKSQVHLIADSFYK